jgi:hypothetical protein
VPELRVEPVLLGSSDPAGLEVKTRIIADHPDEETRRTATGRLTSLKDARPRVPGFRSRSPDQRHRPGSTASGWMPTG